MLSSFCQMTNGLALLFEYLLGNYCFCCRNLCYSKHGILFSVFCLVIPKHYFSVFRNNKQGFSKMKGKMDISALRFGCANNNGTKRLPLVHLVIPKTENYVSDLRHLETLPLGKQVVSFLKSLFESLRNSHLKFLFRGSKKQGKPKCFSYFDTPN